MKIDHGFSAGTVINCNSGETVPTDTSEFYACDHAAGQRIDRLIDSITEVDALMTARGRSVSVKTTGNETSGCVDAIESICHSLTSIDDCVVLGRSRTVSV